MGFLDVLGVEDIEKVADKIIQRERGVSLRASPVPLIKTNNVEALIDPGNHPVPHTPGSRQGVDENNGAKGAHGTSVALD
ncbi:hypothetical protein NicSoilE8_03000 [Arthrobacter sp. NicSoilE8]|nr:hypothetical protein AYX19_01780 [Paenarthrobacter ureafaciens]BCW82627.1 hypothetical protein NicSoilE8_03000 [Arthrobacter sp. NicSoilE8]